MATPAPPDMNSIIRNRARGVTPAAQPTPTSVIRDLKAVAAGLDPARFDAFRAQIADALDAVEAAQPTDTAQPGGAA